MKKSFVLIFILHVSMILSAQNIKTGIYTNGSQCLCIKYDTLIYHDDLYWFKGTYKIANNKLYWGRNVLLGLNANIIQEKCSQDSIEIRLITKHIGYDTRDTTIYQDESFLYDITINNKSMASRSSSGIYIAKGQFEQFELDSGFHVNDSGHGFTDFFVIPLKYGTRYVIIQKYYQFRPIPEYGGMKDYSLIKYKNGNVLLKYSPSYERHFTTLKYISPNCDSCINELRNKFPLLFE